jgi:hypothetical protein
MIRKARSILLLLAVCGLGVVSVDCARHAMAIERLLHKPVIMDDWTYRLLDRPVSGFVASHSIQLKWWRFMVAYPRTATLFATSMDEAQARDLNFTGVKHLNVTSCRNFSPSVARQLAQRSSIQVLSIEDSDLADEGLDLLWSGLPDLKTLDIASSHPLTGDGFNGIKNARKLKSMTLNVPSVQAGVIAHLREAPALEELTLLGMIITPEDTATIASMPALRRVLFANVKADASALAEIQRRNPKLKVDIGSWSGNPLQNSTVPAE